MTPRDASDPVPPPSSSDAERVRALRAGDRAAFESIFREWYPRLVVMADRMLRDRAVAEDVAQDVMLAMWQRREAMIDGTSISAYLFQATRNRALNHLRHLQVRRRAATRMDLDAGRDASAPSAAVAKEMQDALRAALDALPPRCREVFELSRVQGLRYAEIATLLDLSVKTVEAQMGKALRTLREHLAPWLPPSTLL